LGSVTEVRPKPMIEVGGQPLLWHLMKHYAHYGHNRFVLCLGYLGEFIKDYFLRYHGLQGDFTVSLKDGEVEQLGDKSVDDWHIVLADTGMDTNTGGRVKAIEKYIDGDLCMLTYGDGLSSVDLAALEDFHRAHGKLATVSAVHPPARFGELCLDGDQVQSFSEKPQTSSGRINGGFFVVARRVIEEMPDDPDISFERHVLTKLAAQGELMAYQHDGFWQCADTVREWEVLKALWDGGQAPWKCW
jgi:glucose-1-phosphate cytidylyltransferase